METHQQPFRENECCPVREDTRRAVALGKDLAAAMRRIRRNLKACSRCAWVDDCWLRQNIAGQINTAIAEVTAEWNRGRNEA